MLGLDVFYEQCSNDGADMDIDGINIVLLTRVRPLFFPVGVPLGSQLGNGGFIVQYQAQLF